jgi:hypothetical protein
MTDNNKRRWYDQDPLLQEAMELLCLSPEDTKDQAGQFILKMQEEVAAEVIERVYESVKKYENKGNRWYDHDPVMIRAIELLRVAPPNVQRLAAKKLIKAITNDSVDELEPISGKEFEQNKILDQDD